MASNQPSASTVDRERIAKYLLIGLLAVGGILLLRNYWNRPPQMGNSEEVFKTVDALYTAVRSKDEKRLGECESRLKGYRESGKLTPAAANSLDSIIRTARSGSWQPATERLYEFMLAQRREGRADQHVHQHPHSSKETAKR